MILRRRKKTFFVIGQTIVFSIKQPFEDEDFKTEKIRRHFWRIEEMAGNRGLLEFGDAGREAVGGFSTW